MSREDRVVDPTPCVVRHVRRAQAGETSTTVLRATYHAAAGAELEALNGEAGWQSAEATAALSDDGNVTVRFPNAAGDDGVLHRERFALLTDPLYRIGEEWLELYREPMSPDSLVAVMTPGAWKLDRGNLELSGPDLMALYTLARSSELDIWHHAPRDVFDWYTRLPVAALAADLTGWTATGAGASSDGWTYTNAAAATSPPGAHLNSPNFATAATLQHDLTGVDGDGWSAAARMTLLLPIASDAQQDVKLIVRLAGGDTVELIFLPGLSGYLGLADGTAIGNGNGGGINVGRTKRTMPGGCSLKILCRGRWVYGFLEGELIARAQIKAADVGLAPDRLTVACHNANVIVERVDVETSLPFGLRGADKGDRRLPGLPTPGGLRGRYWNEAAAGSLTPSLATGLPYQTMDPLRDPSDSRLDATLNFTAAGWAPAAALPASGYYSARWTGAVYLDLSGNGRRLRIGALDGGARVWIGKTLRLADAAIDSWNDYASAKADLRTANLNTLGPSGWYPIVVEYLSSGPTFKLTLEESALDAGGAPTGGWTTVPSSKLSPFGCYEETHRLESHRELLSAVADGFGYQWRVEPRTLESGEFPGQVIPRVRVGVDTDLILPGDHATDLASEGDAKDAVDRLLIDAAGIADPKGAQQLTADVVNDVAVAAGHLFLSSGVESLPEVSEEALLTQRADSLLALRSGPNEQIGARPESLPQALTDTFPLTGALARRRWRPGDGLRLALEDLSVVDATPRQLLAVTWPLFRAGAGAPVVGWRQRPRGLRAFLQRTARATYAGQRNYQGQTAIITGSLGYSALADVYSRMPLPTDPQDVLEVYMVVWVIAGAATIEINGVNTGIPANAPGRYRIDRYAGQLPGAGAQPGMYGRLLQTTPSYQCFLEAKVRVH